MKYITFARHYSPLEFDTIPGPMNETGSTGTGNELSPEMKTYYNTNLINLVGPYLVHDQFGQQENIPMNHGKTIEFRGFRPLTKALTPLTEGVTPQGEKLDMFTVVATLKQYGSYVTLTDMLEFTAVDKMILQAQERCGEQAGLTLDTVTREVINAGTNVQYGDGSKTSRAALTQEDLLTVKAIKKAVRALKKQNTPKINGIYPAVINPDVAYDLSEDPEYKELIKYTENSQFKNGFLYRLSGVEFYESTEAKIFASTGASGIDVYSTILFGKGAYGVTKLAGNGLQTIIKQKGSAGSADPLDQRSTVGWKATKAVAILVDQYMLRIETGSTFNDHQAN